MILTNFEEIKKFIKILLIKLKTIQKVSNKMHLNFICKFFYLI